MAKKKHDPIGDLEHDITRYFDDHEDAIKKLDIYGSLEETERLWNEVETRSRATARALNDLFRSARSREGKERAKAILGRLDERLKKFLLDLARRENLENLVKGLRKQFNKLFEIPEPAPAKPPRARKAKNAPIVEPPAVVSPPDPTVITNPLPLEENVPVAEPARRNGMPTLNGFHTLGRNGESTPEGTAQARQYTPEELAAITRTLAEGAVPPNGTLNGELAPAAGEDVIRVEEEQKPAPTPSSIVVEEAPGEPLHIAVTPAEGITNPDSTVQLHDAQPRTGGTIYVSSAHTPYSANGKHSDNGKQGAVEPQTQGIAAQQAETTPATPKNRTTTQLSPTSSPPRTRTRVQTERTNGTPDGTTANGSTRKTTGISGAKRPDTRVHPSADAAAPHRTGDTQLSREQQNGSSRGTALHQPQAKNTDAAPASKKDTDHPARRETVLNGTVNADGTIVNTGTVDPQDDADFTLLDDEPIEATVVVPDAEVAREMMAGLLLNICNRPLDYISEDDVDMDLSLHFEPDFFSPDERSRISEAILTFSSNALVEGTEHEDRMRTVMNGILEEALARREREAAATNPPENAEEALEDAEVEEFPAPANLNQAQRRIAIAFHALNDLRVLRAAGNGPSTISSAEIQQELVAAFTAGYLAQTELDALTPQMAIILDAHDPDMRAAATAEITRQLEAIVERNTPAEVEALEDEDEEQEPPVNTTPSAWKSMDDVIAEVRALTTDAPATADDVDMVISMHFDPDFFSPEERGQICTNVITIVQNSSGSPYRNARFRIGRVLKAALARREAEAATGNPPEDDDDVLEYKPPRPRSARAMRGAMRDALVELRNDMRNTGAGDDVNHFDVFSCLAHNFGEGYFTREEQEALVQPMIDWVHSIDNGARHDAGVQIAVVLRDARKRRTADRKRGGPAPKKEGGVDLEQKDEPIDAVEIVDFPAPTNLTEAQTRFRMSLDNLRTQNAVCKEQGRSLLAQDIRDELEASFTTGYLVDREINALTPQIQVLLDTDDPAAYAAAEAEITRQIQAIVERTTPTEITDADMVDEPIEDAEVEEFPAPTTPDQARRRVGIALDRLRELRANGGGETRSILPDDIRRELVAAFTPGYLVDREIDALTPQIQVLLDTDDPATYAAAEAEITRQLQAIVERTTPTEITDDDYVEDEIELEVDQFPAPDSLNVAQVRFKMTLDNLRALRANGGGETRSILPDDIRQSLVANFTAGYLNDREINALIPLIQTLLDTDDPAVYARTEAEVRTLLQSIVERNTPVPTNVHYDMTESHGTGSHSGHDSHGGDHGGSHESGPAFAPAIYNPQWTPKQAMSQPHVSDSVRSLFKIFDPDVDNDHDAGHGTIGPQKKVA